MTDPVGRLGRSLAPGDAPGPFPGPTAPIPIARFETDDAGNLVAVDEAWRAITGCTDPTPISSDQLAALVHPDDRATLVGAWPSSATTGTSVEGRGRIVRPDGTIRHVCIQATRCRSDGDPGDREAGYRYLGSMIDVTDLVEAGEALASSQQRYRSLMINAPVGQAVYGLDGRLIEVNRAWAHLLGYEPHEVLGHRVAGFVHPDDRDEVIRAVGELVDGTRSELLAERRLRHRDGRTVWVSSSITLELNRADEAPHLHSMVIDITERVEAEQALRASESNLRDLVEALHDGVLVMGRQGVELANPRAIGLLGHTFEELQDPQTYESFNLIDADGTPIPYEQRAPIRAMRTGRPVIGEVVGMVLPGRGRRWFSSNALPRFENGQVVGAVLTFSDITDRKITEDLLRESETRFRTLADSLPVGVFHTNEQGQMLYVNPRWQEITGYASLADYHPAQAFELVHPDDREALYQLVTDSAQRGHPFFTQYRSVNPTTGAIRWISARGTPTIDPDSGALTGYIGSLEDVTALVAAQEETTRLAGIIESTSDLVGIAEYPSLRIIYLNRATRETLGLGDDPRPLHTTDLYTEEAISVWRQRIEPALVRGEPWIGELPMRTVDGRVMHVWQTIAADRDSQGQLYQVFAVGRDVTERRRQEAALAHQATHDPLTGLPNRALLLDHLDLALARAGRDHGQVALLFLDLDRFKQVNDSLGHRAGDELLVEAAHRIAQVLRPADTVARLGGDEFVILCDEVADEHHAVTIAQRINAQLVGTPFVVESTPIEVRSSIGIALANGEVEHPEALLRDADAAMYRAKDLGRDRIEVFDESMRRRTAHRLQLADELAQGIAEGQIVVHYQPAVDLATGRVTRVEALARWDHPDRGLLGPVEFIGLAEETGLIVGLGLSVLGSACEQAQRWSVRLGEAAPAVHVNLSARQLASPNLALVVQSVLARTGLPAGQLCLEITESVLMEDAAATIDTLWSLKGLGVSLAIDDFGTGYSSLSYLRRFPVDVLKVDRSFVDGLGPDPEDSAIVAAIIGLAHTLELEAIAEGVESPQQVDRLRLLGCTSAQGFHFTRPVPDTDLEPLLTRVFPV